MDTYIWGPPVWKLLHSMSFAPPALVRAHHDSIVRFMESFKVVLPCKYCRTSYVAFLRDLPSLSETIAAGELSRWMFALHCMVNAKLKTPSPTFERVSKKHVIRRQQWCPSDLWEIVALFGINYRPEKTSAYREWWVTLGVVVGVAGGESRLVELLGGVECPCTNGEFVATSLVLSHAYNRLPPPSRAQIRSKTGQYSLAIAKACTNGTCG